MVRFSGVIAFALLAILTVGFAPLAVRAQTSGGKQHAVLIANQNYPGGAKWEKLNTPLNDATQLAKVLEERYGFVVHPLVKDARREEVIAAIFKLRQVVTEADSVLIFYAGHGQLDEANDRGYWIPIDAELYDPSRWLSVNDITDQIKALRAKHVIVIADACYSGTLVRGSRSGLLGNPQERIAYLRRMAEKKARTAMVSGGIELVADGGGGGHSVFVRALLDALRENREVVDGFELFQRIRQTVIANAAQTPQYADIRFAGHDGGDFLFAPRGARLNGPTPSIAPTPHDPVELAFWQSADRGGAGTVGDYEAYLAQYPRGMFASLARSRIETLKAAAEKLAAAARPPPPAAPATRPVPAVGRPAAPVPGSRFRDCAACPDMVWLPPGRFLMGSAESETAAEGGTVGTGRVERPQHEVRIGYPLAVGVYEVTRQEYAAFVRATGRGEGDHCYAYEDGQLQHRDGLGWRDPGFPQDDRHPAVCVDREEALAYADWLSAQTGQRYRLLSEAEWEYAARAGTTSARWWGASPAAACANANVHDGTSQARNGFSWAPHRCEDGFAQTAPVGSFAANAFGLHDMLGNVWEWVADCWNDSYVDAPSDGSAHAPDGCGWGVLRGGAWDSDPVAVRTANRGSVTSVARNGVIGFRVARTQ